MQKRKFIKWLALVAILSVSLSQLLPSTFATEGEPIVSPLADETEEPDNHPKISIDYLGISPTPGSGPPAIPGELPLTESGVVFWVGVSVDKLSQVDFIRDTGLYGVEIAFDYNPVYVEPWCDLADSVVQPTSSETVKSEAWRDTLKAYNFTDGAGKNDLNVWDSTLFELVETDSVRRTEIDTDPYREEVIPESWKMSFVSIQKKAEAAETVETNRFQGVADDTAKYILKMPFYLRDIPANGAKPLVFKLSRGPSTLVMNSGANGYENFAAWEKEDRSEPPHNLKKIFAFGGDLNIFGGSSDASAMTDLIVTGEVDGGETTFDKYGDNTLGSVVPYTVERTGYYVRVPAEISEVTLTMAGLTEPPQEIRHSDNSSPPAETVLTASPATGGGYMVDVTLVDVDMSKNSGFNNTVTINLGDTSYFVYIQKLVEPRIVLNPGNSPYGMIERMGAEYHKEGDTWTPWTAEEITAAKEAFANSDPVDGNLHYAPIGNELTARVPIGGQTEYPYSTQAWQEPGASTIIEKNYDLDSEAMFVYYDSQIQDVGLKVFDSVGNEAKNVTVTSKVELDNYRGGLPTYTDTDFAGNDSYGVNDYGVQNKPISELVYDISLLAIRPKVYEIEYICTYVDELTGEEVTFPAKKRPLIVLARRGDVQINLGGAAVNPGDASTLTQNWGQITSRSKLFAFRIADVQNVSTSANAINPGDASTLTQRWGTIGQSASTQYYSQLTP